MDPQTRSMVVDAFMDLVAESGWLYAMTTPHEPLPEAAPTLRHDVCYDVGAGPRRILVYAG